MVIYPYGEVAVVESLKVERVEHEQVFRSCGRHQSIYTLLILCDYRFLEPVFFVFAFPLVV